jgi:hypothetical protein
MKAARRKRPDDRGRPAGFSSQSGTDEALLRQLTAGGRELSDLRLENGDLRRELTRVLEKDRRLWEQQAETRALRAEYDDVTAALDAAACERVEDAAAHGHALGEMEAHLVMVETRAGEQLRRTVGMLAQKHEELAEAKDALRQAGVAHARGLEAQRAAAAAAARQAGAAASALSKANADGAAKLAAATSQWQRSMAKVQQEAAEAGAHEKVAVAEARQVFVEHEKEEVEVLLAERLAEAEAASRAAREALEAELRREHGALEATIAQLRAQLAQREAAAAALEGQTAQEGRRAEARREAQQQAASAELADVRAELQKAKSRVCTIM